MKNSSTLCLQALKSSMKKISQKYLKIQRENIKNLKLFYLVHGNTLIRWLLFSFYNDKGIMLQ